MMKKQKQRKHFLLQGIRPGLICVQKHFWWADYSKGLASSHLIISLDNYNPFLQIQINILLTLSFYSIK